MRKRLKELLIILSSLIFPDRRKKVIFYHDIGQRYTSMGTPESLFMRHVGIISSVDEDRRPIVCFDDGFRGVWDYRAILPQLKTKIIVFLAIRLIGECGYLTWDEISVLKEKYGIDFQSHTWSHQTLAGPMIGDSPREERSDVWFSRELLQSRIELSRRLSKEVDSLCFPVGHYSRDVMSRAGNAGYKRCYASFPGDIPSDLGDNVVLIPRCIVQDVSPCCLRAILSGGMNMMAKRYQRKHLFET